MNIEAQIGEILRTPSLGRYFLVLIKKECILQVQRLHHYHTLQPSWTGAFSQQVDNTNK